MRVLLLAIAFLISVPACGASARDRAVQSALVTTNAARDVFIAFDRQHQAAIVAAATSEVGGAAALAEYRTKRAIAVTYFEALYRALAIAAVITDDPNNLTVLARAAGMLFAELRVLGVDVGGAL